MNFWHSYPSSADPQYLRFTPVLHRDAAALPQVLNFQSEIYSWDVIMDRFPVLAPKLFLRLSVLVVQGWKLGWNGASEKVQLPFFRWVHISWNNHRALSRYYSSSVLLLMADANSRREQNYSWEHFFLLHTCCCFVLGPLYIAHKAD